jgi:Leucine-rich repeat (LRR) protein
MTYRKVPSRLVMLLFLTQLLQQLPNADAQELDLRLISELRGRGADVILLHSIANESQQCAEVAIASASDADLDLICRLGKVRKLTISHASISSKGLRRLETLPHLEEVALTHVVQGESDIESLSRLSQIRRLDLSHSRLATQDLSSLKKLKELTSLKLAHTNATDSTIESIVDCKELRTLCVSDSQVTFSCIASSVAKMASLRVLDMSGVKLTSDSLAPLTTSRIEGLYLSRTGITDESLNAISNIKFLREIAIEETAISERGLVNWGFVKQLDRIVLDDKMIGSESVAQLKTLKPGILILVSDGHGNATYK